MFELVPSNNVRQIFLRNHVIMLLIHNITLYKKREIYENHKL